MPYLKPGKKGLAENRLSEELQKLVINDYSSSISKATCSRAISWLYYSGIIGFCGKITELDILNFKAASSCYFMDLGVANYYFTRVGTNSRTLIGTLNENYVYINLKKRLDFPAEIAFETPAFATFTAKDTANLSIGAIQFQIKYKGLGTSH